MDCARNESIAHNNDATILSSTFSSVHHHNTTPSRNGAGKAASSLLFLSSQPDDDLQGVTRTEQSSKLLLAPDRVLWGVIRDTPSPCETSVRPFLWPSSRSLPSLQSLDEVGEEADELEQKTGLLLDQACEIVFSSIHIDHASTPDHIPTNFDHLPLANSEPTDTDAYNKVTNPNKYRQDLLTDDLGMFYEELRLSRSRCSTTAPSRMDRKLRVFQGRK